MISSWIFDVFIIWKPIFLIQPTLSPSTVQCVPHPPEICIANPHFYLIYQGVLQRICGMLSVKIRSFLTMLRCFGLLSKHWSGRLLQQNPHPNMQPLHPKLQSDPDPFPSDILRTGRRSENIKQGSKKERGR